MRRRQFLLIEYIKQAIADGEAIADERGDVLPTLLLRVVDDLDAMRSEFVSEGRL